MADPKLDIEIRIQGIEQTVKRIEEAVSTMAVWLVSAQTGFGQKDMEGINDILYGRTETAPEGSSREAEER